MAVQGPALPVLPATPPGGARCGPDAEARIRRRRGPRTGWPVPQAGCGCTQTSPEASSSRTGARRKPPPPEHALCGLEMAAYRAASEVVFLLFAVCYFSLKGKPESLGVARAVTQTPTHHIQMQCGASPTHCKAHVQAPSKYARSTRRSVLCLSPLDLVSRPERRVRRPALLPAPSRSCRRRRTTAPTTRCASPTATLGSDQAPIFRFGRAGSPGLAVARRVGGCRRSEAGGETWTR